MESKNNNSAVFKNKKKTNFSLILKERSISQKELIEMYSKHYPNSKKLLTYQLSLIVNGKHQNYSIKLAKKLAKILDVKIDEIAMDINLED